MGVWLSSPVWRLYNPEKPRRPIVRMLNWQNFYLGTRRYGYARSGGWRPLSPDTVTIPKRGTTQDRGS
ncbi:Uncharacterized protein FWK35_00012829 [Aphis craccivora]|uniref:Uncharacterized protein n=1 Tax=Aphis craccivora TaxID=307492 RepID=A0A6G0ZP11_APHCR|nr:Uncharacterized protein FWK35_00012829 [Aphis craccivora]